MDNSVKGLKKRETSYDLIRVIAMCFVVILHISSRVGSTLIGPARVVYDVIEMILYTSNGLFFMLGGRFNLRPLNGKLGSFYAKRLVLILLPFFICSFGTYLLEGALIPDSTVSSGYLEALLEEYPKSHYWFVYPYTMLMIAAPFIAAMLEKLQEKNLVKEFVVVALALQFGFVAIKDLGYYPPVEYMFSGWALYFVLGKVEENRKTKSWMIFGVGLFLSIVISATKWVFSGFTLHNTGDLALNAVLLCYGLYMLLRQIEVPNLVGRIVEYIARHSYYVYLLHNSMVKLFYRDVLGLNSRISSLIGAAPTMAVCFVLVIIVSLSAGIVIEAVIMKPVKLLLRKMQAVFDGV